MTIGVAALVVAVLMDPDPSRVSDSALVRIGGFLAMAAICVVAFKAFSHLSSRGAAREPRWSDETKPIRPHRVVARLAVHAAATALGVALFTNPGAAAGIAAGIGVARVWVQLP